MSQGALVCGHVDDHHCWKKNSYHQVKYHISEGSGTKNLTIDSPNSLQNASIQGSSEEQ